MSVATMANQDSPTLPEVEGYELQGGFHQLVQYSARSQHQPSYSIDNGSYIPSGSTFNTPEPDMGQWYVDQYGNRSFMYHNQSNIGGDIHYDGYGQPIYHPHQDSTYQGLPGYHQYPNPAIYSASPLPTSSDQETPPRRTTRSKAPAASNDSRHSSPKPKRKAGKTTLKPKTLSGPLSELTRDMEHIPIKDTELWVNRSVEDRQQEAKKHNFVKRPSNSFILYRSAYADRARSFQKSANHQIVSSLAGESWAMEPPEIRKQYDAWAKIERENHAKAFPEYKFQPQTNKASARKRKGRGEESDEEEGDLDSDYAYEPKTAGRALRSKRAKNNSRDSSNTPSGTSLDEYDPYGQDGASMFHPSSYQLSNPGKPLPVGLTQLGAGQYYQQTSHPNQRLAQYGYIEDVLVQATDVPAGYHQPAPPVIGIPGAYHHELQGKDGGQTLGQLDPMLASYDQGHGRLSISNGHAGQNSDAPQTGSYPVGAYSPVLNDFESEQGDPDFGSDEWWKQNKDR